VVTAERDVALNARLAFYQAIAAEGQIKVGEESAETYRRQLEQTRALYDSGLRTKIDVATAESGLASAELTLARARAGLEMARASLAASLGEESWGDWRLRFDPADFESRPEDQARSSTPEPALAETALRRRSELTELELLARSYADQARSQRGQYLPQLTLGATPSWAGEQVSSMIGNLTLSISLSYPLGGMSPLLVRGQIREAEGNLLSARARERAERVGIRQELRNARALLVAAGEEVRSAHRLVEAAAAQRDLAIGRYASGVGTIIELQNALLNDVTARFQLVQAGYDLTAARAQLQHALGEDD
jgi:outer membrane protein